MRNATYEHFFYASTQETANALAAALQQVGALVPNAATPSASPDEPGYEWLIMAFTKRGDPIEEGFTELARRHGGVYDGGGMFVG